MNKIIILIILLFVVSYAQIPGRQQVIGYTSYDWQYNGPVYSHCRVDPVAYGIHCYWMYSNFAPATDRNQRYNFYDFSTRTWNWIEGINVFPHRCGFGGMDYNPITGCAVTSTHQGSGTTIQPNVAQDIAPGVGIYGYCPGPIGYQWPPIAVTNNQTIHCVMADNASTDSLCYARIQPWCTWSSPIRIYTTYFPSYNIAASKISNKVIILWVTMMQDSVRDPAYYKLSNDGGTTWGPTTQIPFPPSQGLVPSFPGSSLFAMFDNQDNFHIVASVSDTGRTVPAEIWHYCPINPQPWTLIYHYAPETLAAPVGYNAIFATRPSIIQDPVTSYFYVTWEVFDSLNYEPITVLSRADIYVAELRNNGQYVSFRGRLTTPNTTSKRFPCIGGIKNTPSTMDYDTLVVMYLIDSIAGFENYMQGRATRNPVVVHFTPQRWISIEEVSAREKYYNFELFPATPNPFSLHTTIRYTLPAQSNVSLSIYDITGRLVKILKSEIKSDGEYSVNWNGQDNQGKSVKNGIYFCSLRTNDKTITRKLIKSD